VVNYSFLKSTAKDAKTPLAYAYSLRHCAGNIKKRPSAGVADSMPAIFDVFKPYAEGEFPKYESSWSDIRFGNFQMTDYMLIGEVPTKKGVYSQKLRFKIRQIAF
jgi:hypothetical protein